MLRSKIVGHAILIAALAFLCWGCSGNGDKQPMLPDAGEPFARISGSTGIWGLWDVVINPVTLEAEVVPLKQADLILNVLGFLEPPALYGMKIDFDTLDVNFAELSISADIILAHPMNTSEDVFHGFDVRGIVIGPRLTNADGHTRVMNPADFASTPFGYSDGLLGVPHSSAGYDGVWGYKYFCDDLGKNGSLPDFFRNSYNLSHRGIFSEWQKNTRHYEISWTGSDYDFLVFNYAVYANYDWPTGDGPYDIDDYPMSTANSSEAFCGDINNVSSSLYATGTEGGGTVSLDIEIWDWQGIDDTEVSLQILGISSPVVAPDSSENGTTPYSRIYHFVNAGLVPLNEGECDLLVKAVDERTFGESWFLGLLNSDNDLYDENIWNGFVCTVPVYSCPPPTVTSINPDQGTAGQVLEDVVIQGQFIDGPSLGVELQLPGKESVIGDDVTFIDATTITCDLDLAAAWGGVYDVVVMNGCGNPGIGEDLFEVEGGITLVDSGNLPTPLPFCDEKAFCVVGDNTYGLAGVYYMNFAYAVMRYPLDYSGVGTTYRVLQGNYGYTILTMLGPHNGIGKIEVDSTGGIMLTSNNTGYTWNPPNRCNQPIFWWLSVYLPDNEKEEGDIMLDTKYAITRSRDVEAEFEVSNLNLHVLWGFYAVEEDFYFEENDIEIVNLGVVYPFNNSSFTPYLSIDWGPLDETPGGSLDGEVSDEEAYRLAIDSEPVGLSSPLNMLFYYLEGAPDDNVIEVIAAYRIDKGASATPQTTIRNVFVGTAIDIAVLPSADNIPLADFNWLVVLEDNGDSTWQIALFNPDGSLIERSITYNGDPLAMDCDTTNLQVHVWVDDASVLKYYVLEWI